MTGAPALALSGSASFGGVVVFRDLSLDVPGGGWTCLLGPSGVGRSPVPRLFAGLRGGLSFSGDIRADDGPLAGRVALMAQSDLLLP